MATAMDLLTQRVNPRLVISISALLVLLVPVAFAVEFVLIGAMGSGKQESSIQSASSEKVVTVPELPPLTNYIEVVQAHELFKPPVEQPKQEVKKIGIAERAKNLELTGIVALDKMEAIIKDRRTRQSYFVNEGSKIEELTVQKIEPDKVILSYEDETHELRIV